MLWERRTPSARRVILAACIASMAVASCAPAFAADDWSLKTGDSSFYTYDTRQVTPVQDLKVNVATGNLVIHARDVDVTGGLMPFSLDRYYNSQAQWSSNLGPRPVGTAGTGQGRR